MDPHFSIWSMSSKWCACLLQDQTDVFIQQQLGGFNYRTSDDKRTISWMLGHSTLIRLLVVLVYFWVHCKAAALFPASDPGGHCESPTGQYLFIPNFPTTVWPWPWPSHFLIHKLPMQTLAKIARKVLPPKFTHTEHLAIYNFSHFRTTLFNSHSRAWLLNKLNMFRTYLLLSSFSSGNFFINFVSVSFWWSVKTSVHHDENIFYSAYPGAHRQLCGEDLV